MRIGHLIDNKSDFKGLDLFNYEHCMLKTEDIHPPKTGISVHFSCSLVCQAPPY